MSRRFSLAAILLASSSAGALAQSSPGLVYGQTPTAGQWNSYFAAKQDVLGYHPLNPAGGVMTGKLTLAPSTTNRSGLNIGQGAAVASPAPGDIWATSGGVFVDINGTVISLTAGSIPVNGAYQTPTNAALGGVLPTQAAVYGSIYRAGWAAAGDGGGGSYAWSASPCSLNGGAGDSGTQVPPLTGTGCWNLAKQVRFTPRQWGAIADGAFHALSTRFGSLGAAQAVCPDAISLSTNSVDWCAMDAAIHYAESLNTGSPPHGFPGQFVATGIALSISGSVNMTGASDTLVANDVSLEFDGIGPQNSELVWNGVDGIHFGLADAGQGGSLTFDNLGIINTGPGGKFITAVFKEPYPTLRLTNLIMRGRGSGWWTEDGGDITGPSYPVIENIIASGTLYSTDISAAALNLPGTGYGATVSGTMTSETNNGQCLTPITLNVSTTAGGAIDPASITIANAGNCSVIPSFSNPKVGITTTPAWTAGGGLTQGTGATFNLTPTAKHTALFMDFKEGTFGGYGIQINNVYLQGHLNGILFEGIDPTDFQGVHIRKLDCVFGADCVIATGGYGGTQWDLDAVEAQVDGYLFNCNGPQDVTIENSITIIGNGHLAFNDVPASGGVARFQSCGKPIVTSNHLDSSTGNEQQGGVYYINSIGSSGGVAIGGYVNNTIGASIHTYGLVLDATSTNWYERGIITSSNVTNVVDNSGGTTNDTDINPNIFSPNVNGGMTVIGNVVLKNLLQRSTLNTFTAAGTTQGTATVANYGLTVISTGSGATTPPYSGAILPGYLGADQTFYNATPQSQYIYPKVGAAINGGTTNAPVTIIPGQYVTCRSFSSVTVSCYIENPNFADITGTAALGQGGTGGTDGLTAQNAMSGDYVLAQSAVAVPHTGDTTETTLASCPVAAGAMGPNGRLRVTTMWSFTNNGNTKTARIRFATTGTGAAFMQDAVTTTSTSRIQTEIDNVNALNVQKADNLGSGATGGWGNVSSGAVVAGSVNTVFATTVSITGQLGVNTDTITLEGYLCELLANSGT